MKHTFSKYLNETLLKPEDFYLQMLPPYGVML